MKRYLCRFACSLLLLSPVLVLQAQVERDFSVPLSDLKTWSESVVVPFTATITGHSTVHSPEKDCEMHMGAKFSGYKGDPPGWVLEPMNLCLETMPKKRIGSKAAWERLGDSLIGETVTGFGVPRLWPEHLKADPEQEDSNPSHATEIHPVIGLTHGTDKYDFSTFVYAPEELAGIKPKTSRGILTNTSVRVKEEGGMVEIMFESGTIGNFALLDITIDRDSITDSAGSFFMDGVAVGDNEEPTDVRLVTVRGSDINDLVGKIKKGARKHVSMEALVLYSLNPQTLYVAAQKSRGKEVAVETPIQLIVYGPPQSSE